MSFYWTRCSVCLLFLALDQWFLTRLSDRRFMHEGHRGALVTRCQGGENHLLEPREISSSPFFRHAD